MPTRIVRAPHPIDVRATLVPLQRGLDDPTMRSGPGVVVRASRTPVGPVTARFADVPNGVEVEAWGPGAEWLLERAPGSGSTLRGDRCASSGAGDVACGSRGPSS
jgi:hypothetical protein